MSKEGFFLHNTPIGELKAMMSEVIDEKLKCLLQTIPNPTDNRSEYLTRLEVCNLLKISLSTLHSYTKHGILQSYKVGGKVLFKSSEISIAVQKIQSLKYKHR